MKLYTVGDPNGDWVGSEAKDGLIDLTRAGVAASMIALIQRGETGLANWHFTHATRRATKPLRHARTQMGESSRRQQAGLFAYRIPFCESNSRGPCH